MVEENKDQEFKSIILRKQEIILLKKQNKMN